MRRPWGALRGCLLVLLLLLAGPARAAVSVEAAHELLSDWQLEDAMAAAQALLAEDPNNPEILFLAARVQHARGEHLSALSLAQAATRGGSGDAAEFLPMLEHTAAYATHFQTLESKHFKIRYLNKDEIVAHYAAPVLESAYANIGGDLELLAAERGEKIAVEIFPDARGLAGATGLTIKEIETSGTIAVCKFHRLMITSPLATANGYGWADTVAHEFTHLVISKKSRNSIPIWLHEGIAKFYESRWKGNAGEALGAYSENLLADATKSGSFITFKQMHPSMAKLPSQKDAALAFAQVFTVIEYLRDKFGPRAIAQVLALAGEGTPLESALTKVFGMGIEQIEAAWRRAVKKREFRLVPGAKPTRIELVGGDKETQAEKPLETMQEKRAHDFSRLGELLQLRNNPRAAILEYEKAHKIAGNRYSTLVTRLARAYTEVGRHDDALKLLQSAAAAHPEDADMHLRAGRLFLAKGQLEEARGQFEAVRLQNPFNPEVHAFFARYHEQTGKPDEAATAKRFLALASKPRERRRFELPSPRPGTARLSVLTPAWGEIELDGKERFATPLWELPVEPGAHTVRFVRADGSVAEERVELASEGARLVSLK